ncbi:uncharacterized protein [Amphiura filiformis]|uniref:uncharacterized protein n=1 Tax=Amphiura filiformis TaxID=82378 RepID=UPI003B210E76
MEDLSQKLMRSIGLNESSTLKSEEDARHKIPLMQQFPQFKKPWTPVGQKSCLVTKLMKQHKSSNSQLSPLVQRMVNSYSNNNNERKPCNAKNKVTWCASSNKQCSSEMESQNPRIPKNVSIHARGRWVIKLDDTSTKPLDQMWVKLCRLSKKGGLPQCNCKLKESEGAIWIYCYLSQARQIFTVLKAEVLLQGAKFYVQGRCLLQADAMGIIETDNVLSDR